MLVGKRITEKHMLPGGEVTKGAHPRDPDQITLRRQGNEIRNRVLSLRGDRRREKKGMRPKRSKTQRRFDEREKKNGALECHQAWFTGISVAKVVRVSSRE